MPLRRRQPPAHDISWESPGEWGERWEDGRLHAPPAGQASVWRDGLHAPLAGQASVWRNGRPHALLRGTGVWRRGWRDGFKALEGWSPARSASRRLEAWVAGWVHGAGRVRRGSLQGGQRSAMKRDVWAGARQRRCKGGGQRVIAS
ncbi:hypothetical protein PMIN01_10967 [Paraphaeosphaeria minitans]|uniref:Uncharacterized protein n=1 Tax=Paraphaeosphaeria minitans TaxID=565426 RepID=A0A9P6G8X6_9PLEO|nr:hypothetical protein PMIN01_10967 [Paraphaeosphaeria minitans]